MAEVKYNKAWVLEQLMRRARTVAGEITSAFFESVNANMPVEEGHAHESLGTGLQKVASLTETIPTASQMLARGSNDPEAASRGYGTVKESKTSLRVTVGTSAGFVRRLDDGETISVGDLSGSTGRKVPGTEGQLYGPRTNKGQGFLMWQDAGGKHFALSVNWGPMGFFAQAADAARDTANQLGAI